MTTKIIAVIILIFVSIIAFVSIIYKLYKNFNELESSDPLNDDFDEHTDQFII
jgi:hypothetical protein